jgi:hypothetical protein
VIIAGDGSPARVATGGATDLEATISRVSISDAPPRLRVQTVLYETELDLVWRLLRALDAAARHALEAGVVRAVDWVLGDSTSGPRLSEAGLEDLRADAAELSVIDYEFFGENLGSSGGQNRLAASGEHEIIFVLNPDAMPAPNALTELVRVLADPRAGIAEARQLPLEHPKAYDEHTGETSWASGACMMVPSTVFAELGGFDHEHFLLHCDDVDFSWRARAAGHRVLSVPQAAVFHDKRLSEAGWPAPEVERFHAVHGRLMLGTRWDPQGEIVRETLRQVEQNGDEVQERAVAAFLARREAGTVPAPAPDTSVATFIDGEYAVHRF